MTILFLIIALLALSYGLSKATDYLVNGLEQLAQGTAFQAYGLTTLVVALATSLPELFVAVASALEGTESLTLGIVLGSNIANISLVIGGAALLSGVVKARDNLFWRDVIYAFVIGMTPLVMMMDKSLSRIDGLVLIGIYLVFSLITLSGKEKKEIKEVEKEYYSDIPMKHKILHLRAKKDVEQGMLRMLVGSVSLIIFSEWIVKLAQEIAVELQLPMILVGLFMISVGTSLPELAFEIKTVSKREYMMAFANIIGSTVVNSSLVLGVSAFLRPIYLQGDAQSYYISVIAFVVIFALFWLMTRTKKKLERWEGGVLVVVYLLFIVAQFFASCGVANASC